MAPNATRKTGRPAKGEARDPLTSITFRADAATLDALARLEATVGGGVVSGRSVAIRRAILDAAARLDGEASQKSRK